MKRNYNFISLAKRFFPLVTAVMVLVCCISFPASAEALNYRDYEVSVTVDGNNDIVTLGFPYEQWADWLFADEDLEYVQSGSGSSFYLDSPKAFRTSMFYIVCAPFGGATFKTEMATVPGHYLSLDNLPSDAKWNMRLEIRLDDEESEIVPAYFGIRSWVVDGDSSFFYEFVPGSSITEIDTGVYDVVLSGDVVTDYDGWFPQVFLKYRDDRRTPVIFSLHSFDITMSINSYHRVLEDMGYTEQIDELRQELEQQNIKLDSVINGTPEQNESANNAAGVLGDKGEQLGNLAGAIQPDKPNLDSVNTNVSDLVPSTGLNSLTSAISPIANNELVIKILVMVATLILVSYVLFGKRG